MEKYSLAERMLIEAGFQPRRSSVKKDGGPGSGNHGHKGVPGQVGGSAPSSRNGRPSEGVKSSKTSLSQEARSKANDSVKKLRSEISKCKEIQENANPKAKDYDPTPFIEAEKRQREIKAEVQTLLDGMPAGTLIEKKRVLYEKNDGGKWIATTCERSYDASSFIAQEVCGIGDTTDKYPARFIESTEDVVQIEDIKLKPDATYREYAENLNGMAKKDLVKLANKNPEFKELVDSIVMYTEGGYVEQRKAFESVSKNGLEGVSAQTVGEHVNGDLYTYRNLWKGQNLEESDANISEGMVTIAKAIEHSDPYDGELYRVAQDRNIYKNNGKFEPYIPPKVGDTITIAAPTSFTSDLDVEQELSKQKNGDVIHYVLESGAKAVNVSELSRYKQKEFLSCGKFVVVRVDTQTKGCPLYLREGEEPSYALQKRGIKEDRWGQKYFDIYDTKITIRYVGDAPIGSREDADSSGFMIDQEHFEDRMILQNEDEHQTDGGPGSGNWGHEGRPGEVGGSAEGGGSHNRMGNKKEGYTSFSKNKKKFATPHKSYWEEYENCPTGSIVLDSYGKWKKNDHGNFINQDTGEKKWSFQMAVDNEGNDIRILAPDDSNPNFKKMKVRDDDRFSSARKKAAFNTSDPAEADKIFREQTGKVWRESDEATKDALNAYTQSTYRSINGALRSGNIPSEEVEKYIGDITDAIDKCVMQQDTYLYRGCSFNSLSKLIGIDITTMGKQNPEAYVGKEVTDKAFLSCGTAKGKGFDDSDVSMVIYCPAGTKAIYAEPFSEYGEGGGRDWDGTSGQKKFSQEFETILQRGSRMQITNMSRGDYGNYVVELQVIDQKNE